MSPYESLSQQSQMQQYPTQQSYTYSPAYSPAATIADDFSVYSSREHTPPFSSQEAAPLAINTSFTHPQDQNPWSSPVSPEYLPTPIAQTPVSAQDYSSYDDPFSFDFSTCTGVNFNPPPVISNEQHGEYSPYATEKGIPRQPRLLSFNFEALNQMQPGSGTQNVAPYGYLANLTLSQPALYQTSH